MGHTGAKSPTGALTCPTQPWSKGLAHLPGWPEARVLQKATLESAHSCPRASGGPCRQEGSFNLSPPGRAMESKRQQSWWAMPGSGGHGAGGSVGGAEGVSMGGDGCWPKCLLTRESLGFLSRGRAWGNAGPEAGREPPPLCQPLCWTRRTFF